MKSSSSAPKEWQEAVEKAGKLLAKKKDQEAIDLVLKEMDKGPTFPGIEKVKVVDLSHHVSMSAKIVPVKVAVNNALWKVTFRTKGIVEKNVTYTVLVIPDAFVAEHFFNNPPEPYFKKHLFKPEIANGWVLLECMFLGSNVNPANHTINYVTKLCKECQSGLEK